MRERERERRQVTVLEIDTVMLLAAWVLSPQRQRIRLGGSSRRTKKKTRL
jgi:hypothetical protein